MNIAMQLDIPKERVRSVISSYYMSTLPSEFHAADHVSFPQENLAFAKQLFENEDFDISGVYPVPEPRAADAAHLETIIGRQKLRRIESNTPLRTTVTRWLITYLRRFFDFRMALPSS